ncbi:MAG TPA: hypothetical protein VK638_54145 [Edaphobacter sp.]|nr:hypothetical protein [Edaphobacter sp.]
MCITACLGRSRYILLQDISRQRNDRSPFPATGCFNGPDLAGRGEAIHYRHLDVHEH